MKNSKQNECNIKRAALLYWLGTIGQISIACSCLLFLKLTNITYPQTVDILFLIVGGTSSALWGVIVSLKYGYKKSFNEIIRDFFDFRQAFWKYLMVIFFIIIIFGVQIFRGKVNSDTYWYTYIVLFLQAIIFGGIEEIGWRYTWQPIIEKKYSFVVACLSTFISWSLWHYMYFYITDSIAEIEHMPFLISMLGNCFILGAIYKITDSLWLCVLYHCLLNVFSQTLQPEGGIIIGACNTVAIIISIVLVKRQKRDVEYSV